MEKPTTRAASIFLIYLDSKSLRVSLDPQPPALNLRWKLIGKVGLAAAAISLIGSLWGFLILGVGFASWLGSAGRKESKRNGLQAQKPRYSERGSCCVVTIDSSS